MEICLERLEKLAEQGVQTNLYSIISNWTLDVICGKKTSRLNRTEFSSFRIGDGKINRRSTETIGIRERRCSVRPKLNQRKIFSLYFSMTEMIALRMRSPWLWPPLFFRFSALGREHNRLLKIIHRFTRAVRFLVIRFY